ncbi:Major Facilitator Superfamily (MFS) [Achlya hypogyna]|uniref:Major Facilitator Superfamily (MFS) n=1 Tax=Achlya hypogyna TaxID=1202772 RepID=A0A1V9Y9X7_ACHHY|nr:Major Facilitator Superfamily (MFS) [Achlya hypogyna]
MAPADCTTTLPAKAVYTINYFGLSAVGNFLTVFFSAYFDKFQIGILQTIPCICNLIAPPLWGAIADILRKQRLIHIFCILTGSLLMFSIQFTASSFYLACFVVFLANFQSGPTSSLLDQAVLALTERLGAEYGKQRLFGAVGYGLGAYITGVIVSNYGITWAFNIHLLFCVPTIFALQMIPSIDAPHQLELTPSGSTVAPPSFSTGLRALMKKTDVLILLFVVFLAGLMFGVLSSFLTLNLYELSGQSAQIVGIAIWCETFSELPAFYFADRIIEKVGTVNALGISILSYGARLTCYALMTNAWYALPFEFLHGCTFSLAWAACTKYIYASAPRGTEGMMMGILNAVQNGLGRGVGTMVGGYLYNTYGASFMWKVTDLGVPVALLAAYGIFNFGFSAALNFLPVYFSMHFDKFQIGVLQTLPSLCSVLAPPLWGALSDKFAQPRLVHVFCYISGSCLMYAVQFAAWSFRWTAVIVFVAHFQSKPAWTLLDQAVLALVSHLGAEYGKQRLFGSIGYGLGAYITGVAVSYGGITWAFTLSLGCVVPGLVLLHWIPSPNHSSKLLASPFAAGFRDLSRKTDLLCLLGVVCVTGAMAGVISSFLMVHLYELSNGSAHIVGAAICCETFSELPAFYYADRLLKSLGTVKMLTISIVAYGARLACYAQMTDAWVALPFECLHGCTYGLAWAACTKYVYSHAPRGTEGFVLGLLSAVQSGLGRGIATIAGGFLYNNYGPSWMWSVTSSGVPVALLGVTFFARAVSSRESTSCESAPLIPDHWAELLPAKAVYTVSNIGGSALINFITVFFSAYFDKFQIGILQTIPAVCSILAPPLWGAISDVLRRQRVVHIFCLVTGTLFMYAIQFAHDSFGWTCALVFLGNFQGNPAASLMDQAVLALVTRLGAEYGKQRLYGAVGYGLGAYIAGLVVAKYGIAWAFNMNVLFLLPTLVVLRKIPPSDSADHLVPESPSSSTLATPSFAASIRTLLTKKDVLGLLFVVFLLGLMCGTMSAFLTLNLYELSGGSAQIVGIAIFCETFSELPAFYFADRIIAKLGTVKVLAISISAYGARLTCYALMTNAWYALPFELLHGCTFGLAWAACTKYIYAAAPDGTKGTMMGILSAVQNGLGRGVGTMVGGYLYNSYGASYMWGITDLGVPLAFLGLYAFAHTIQEPMDEKNVGSIQKAPSDKDHLLAAVLNFFPVYFNTYYNKLEIGVLQTFPAFVAKRKELLPAKLVYVFFNVGYSSVQNFLPVYFNTYFTKFEIGLLQTIPCICSLLAPPLWGAIADVFHKQRLVHILCLLTASALMFSIQFASSSFVWTCVLMFCANFQATPLWPLLDQTVLALVTRLGAEYGKQRLYGAVGWGLGAYVTGLIVASFGISWAFNMNLLFCLPTVFTLLLIPAPDAAEHFHTDAATPKLSFIDGVKIVATKKDVLGLLLVVFLGGTMFGILSAFLMLNFYELSGGSAQIVGIAIWCETFSELPAFYYADRILAKLGTVKVLAISIAAYGARLTCYALMTNPWYALPFEFLHGCTYGLAWAAATKYIYAEVPRGTEGLMMGLLSAVQTGLGRGVGTSVGGYLYNTYGASTMWAVADMAVPLAFVGLYIFSCTMKKHPQETTNTEKDPLLVGKVDVMA